MNIIYNFVSRTKANEKEIYDIKQYAYKLILLLVGTLTLLWFFVDLFFFDRPATFVISLLINTILCYSMFFLMSAFKNIRVLSLITAAYIAFVLIPVITLNGSVNNSSTPIWICSGMMLMFFVFDFKDFFIMFILSFYIETFLYATGYIKNTEVEDVSSIMYFLTFLFAFLSVVAILYFVIDVQEKHIQKVKSVIDANESSKRRTAYAKSTFLTSMSHDIRTPMNSIIGISELVFREKTNDELFNEVSVIKSSAYDLLEIIDDVLIYSKLDSAEMEIQKNDVELEEFFRQLIDSIRTTVNDKNIILKIDIAGDIPKKVYADSSKIKQVFIRLFFVALSMTDNGRIIISINGKYTEDKNHYIFECSVSDTGRGLKQADLDAIYGVYSVYDSKQNSNLKGIGLKYTICRELLKLMDGDLDVSSIENVGTTASFNFTCKVTDSTPMLKIEDAQSKKVLIYVSDDFELNEWKNIMDGFKIRPVYVNSFFTFNKTIDKTNFDYIFVPENLYPNVSGLIDTYNAFEKTYVICTPDKTMGAFGKSRIVRIPITSLSIDKILNNRWNAKAYESTDDKIDYDGTGAKVLVVDDNNVNLRVAMSIFKRFKINIDVANSGEEAINKLKQIDYDLVLMDMVMPEMTGEETLINIRKSDEVIRKNVPIIALTATVGENIREEILGKGFQEYLAKPIKVKYLTEALIKFLPPSVFKVSQDDAKAAKEVKANQNENDLLKAENVLDTGLGKFNIGGVEENYAAILNTYYTECNKHLINLPELLKAGDISLFTTFVHGIKSSSLSVGAKTVSAMFKELEFAGKDGNIGLINEKYEPYSNALRKILEDVKNYLISINQFVDPDKEECSKSDVEKEELTQEIILEFKSYVDKMDLKHGDEMMEDLYKRNFGEKNETIAKIKTHYDQFDFHEVKQLLNGLIEG